MYQHQEMDRVEEGLVTQLAKLYAIQNVRYIVYPGGHMETEVLWSDDAAQVRDHLTEAIAYLKRHRLKEVIEAREVRRRTYCEGNTCSSE